MSTAKEQYEQEKSELLKCALPISAILTSKSRSYKVVSVLGAGGFGITYKVSSDIKVGNVSMRTYFAIKEHFMKGCSRDTDRASILCATTVKKDYEHSLSDFLTEAHRLNKLGTQSANIVKVNEVFTANGTAYYVMEFLDGGDLLQYVHKNGALGESKALSMIIPIAKAVGVLHKERLLHLDIKPDNIVLKKDVDTGTVTPVLIDFGIAKHFDSKGNPTTLPSAKGATPGYAPIEQYLGVSKFAPEIDVYSLGATLYFLLTGKNPPMADNIHSSTDLLVNIPQEVSEQTKRAICHAMKSSKIDRTPNVDAFIKSVAKLHSLPIGYVLHSISMSYLILDIVSENSYSITYKAIPINDVNGSESTTNNEPLGNPTVTRIQYYVHELFTKGGHRRNEDGSLTATDSKTVDLRSFSEEADKTIPSDFLNVYDDNGYVKAQKFRTNNTLYYSLQIVKKPSPIILLWRNLKKTISNHKKALAATFATIAICLATYYLWPIITTNRTNKAALELTKAVTDNDSTQTAASLTQTKSNYIPSDFVLVPSGTLNNKEWNENKQRNEYKSYKMDSFYICKYELTQGEYERVMGKLGAKNYSFEYGEYGNKKRTVKGSNIPIIGTYLEFAEYCNKRSEAEGYDGFYDIKGSIVSYKENGNGYRLLHEREWTYAAKGGNANDNFRYVGSNNVKEVAWYGGNSNDKPHAVGGKKANRLGLYDMAGNVHEMLQSTDRTNRLIAGGSYHDWTGYDSELFGPYSFWGMWDSSREGARIALIPKKGTSKATKGNTLQKTNVQQADVDKTSEKKGKDKEKDKGQTNHSVSNNNEVELDNKSVESLLQNAKNRLDAIKEAASPEAKESAPEWGF